MSNISPLSTAAVTAANKPTAKPSAGASEANGSAKAATPASSAIVSLSAEGLSKAAADSGKDATPSSARA
jgi:hypothetical protein